ncbi:GntR family transcriptional regulator [Candidatus Sumerlaeota bacterium]|nr:GntR family transcriptional regulator [Candidatus Sumerlaeota bacterium]
MILSVDPASGLPIYLQIVQQVKWRIATGALRAGERLPSVREIAGQVRVNPNTVAKAITELERAGVVETRRGSGTFVAEGSVTLTRAERRRLVREACDRAVTDAFHLQWPHEDLHALFEESVNRIYRSE